MKKVLALISISFIGFGANASTQAWVSTDKAIILLEGNSIERDAINLYDSLNAPIMIHFVGGLEIASKEINFKNADGSQLLNIFCSVSTDGTDLGQCFVTIESNKIMGPAMTVFNQVNENMYLSITGQNQSASLARLFTGFTSSGEVFQSGDSRFVIRGEFDQLGLKSFVFQYL